MKRIKVEIEGMTCPNCERHVKEGLEKIGAKKIIVSHEDGSAIFSMKDSDSAHIKDAVKKAGYNPKDILVKEEEKSMLGRFFR